MLKYMNCRSETRQVECGVPQGSVLGPLLFMLNMNVLPDAIDNDRSLIFVGDATIYIYEINIKGIYRQMYNELNTEADWY